MKPYECLKFTHVEELSVLWEIKVFSLLYIFHDPKLLLGQVIIRSEDVGYNYNISQDWD